MVRNGSARIVIAHSPAQNTWRDTFGRTHERGRSAVRSAAKLTVDGNGSSVVDAVYRF